MTEGLLVYTNFVGNHIGKLETDGKTKTSGITDEEKLGGGREYSD
jgi:hypothetical protein